MKSKYSLPKDGGLIASSTPSDIIHRCEKIRTRVYDSEYAGVQYVADTIVKAIRNYNESHCSNGVYEEGQPFVLGLTTGRTPLGLYRELVKRHAVYSLDEFYPIKSSEQQSRNYRIHEDFLNHIDILPENVHIPDGTISKEKISEYCASYDQSVRKIDLMIMGVGEDGQIGFNEPGSYAKSRTRLVQLTYNTRKIQSGAFFGLENTPKMAITMGIGTIMRADKIILMAWGEEKADIVQRVVEGEIHPQVPASNLQAHPNSEVVNNNHNNPTVRLWQKVMAILHEGKENAPPGAPQHRGGHRRERRTPADARADPLVGRPLRMDTEIRPQGRGMALRRGGQTDPEAHLQGLHRKFAG